jgi:hypothetical protein
MIGNTAGFPVGIPLGVYALLWSRNLETPARVRRQPLGPVYARDGPTAGFIAVSRASRYGSNWRVPMRQCPQPKGTRRDLIAIMDSCLERRA